MGWIGATAVFVLDLIIYVGTLCAIIVIEVLATVAIIISAIGHSVALIALALLKTTIALLTLNITGVAATWSLAIGQIGLIWTGAIASIAANVTLMKITYEELMFVTKFKIISRIHTLGMMVSAQYRKLMMDFGGKMGEIGKAIGVGDQAMQLLLRHSQGMSQVFSAMIGRSYEIGHLDFIKTMQNWRGFDAMIYANREIKFEELVDWIDSDGITRIFSSKKTPYGEQLGEAFGQALDVIGKEQLYEYKDYDLKMMAHIFNGMSGWRGVEIGTIDGIVQATDKLAQKQIGIDKRLDDLDNELPAAWAEDIRNFVGPGVAEINEKIIDEYEPAIKSLQMFVNIQRDENLNTNNRLNDIADRIDKPGNMLEAVDRLDLLEQKIQERKISEVSNRSLSDESNLVNEEIEKYHEITKSKFIDVTTKAPKEAWQGKEKEKIQYQPGEEPDKDKTWFAGDY